ncbi:MAG: hypothetical protein RLY97_1752 [Pseudomonadota bacterium]
MSASLSSGKNHKQENFPVASWLVRPDARAPILAYYRFARASDDIADHPTAAPQEKLRLLAEMRRGLAGEGAAEAMELAQIAGLRGLDLAHAHDLLGAFEQDVTVNRTATWEALIAYCAMSAMPVGRFVLDVHGEDRGLWPLSDALCAALQVLNHVQDCGKDYRAIDRVYVPQDMLDAAGVPVTALAAARCGAELRAIMGELAGRTMVLLDEAAPFARRIADWRLAAEVAVIHALAVDLTKVLLRRDPLAEKVHHGKIAAGWLALRAVLGHGWRRLLL